MTPFLEIAGWTLIHFVWQGAAVGLAAAMALKLAAHRSPSLRYLLACTGLALMLAAPIATARLLSVQAATVAQVSPATSPVVAARPDASAVDPKVRTTPEVAQAFRPAIGGQIVRAFRSAESAGFELSARVVRSVTMVWLLGVSLLLGRMAGGWWYVRR